MENVISLQSIGKMYKLYADPKEKIIDILHLERLRFWKPQINYTEFWALRELNLEIPQGERLGIVGRNGAGKSTLLKIITGNIKPTEGKVDVKGNVQVMMQLGTGFHPEFTGRENIFAALSYAGVSRTKAKEFEDDIIEFSELEEYIDQPVKTYSAGMYARLAFAVSTVITPDILVIDEVLGAGDAAFVTKCAERMKQLTSEKKTTVLFVSHSMESVLQICDNAILLDKGNIIAKGTALEISKIYNKMVRAEDELYLRAKEYKMRKKDVRAMASTEQTQKVFLFRLVTDKEHPQKRHKIYSISLESDKELERIDVGVSMDNSIDNASRIIDGKAVMDWGISEKDDYGRFRYYENQKGKMMHAPFQLAVPTYLEENVKQLRIFAKAESDEHVYVDFWNGESYQRIGTLKEGFGETVLQIAKEIITEKDESTNIGKLEQDSALNYNQLKAENSIYGDGKIRLERVDLVDETGESSRVFTALHEMTFKMEIKMTQQIKSFVLTIAIMTTDGKAITQVFCPSDKLEIDFKENTIEMDACFSPLKIGEGEYMASVGLYKKCVLTNQAEDESYCVVDRAVFFKIVQPECMQKKLGMVIHDCSFRHNDVQWTYNPVEEHGKEENR